MARMTPDLAKKFLGVQKDGKLSKCPDMPNCVCSCYSEDAAHAIDPLIFQGSAEEAKARIKKVIGESKGFKIVEEKAEYMRVEVTSSLFKFVDDVEFLIKSSEKKIHLRSASRLGKWDVGANKKRMKLFAQAFASATARG